MTSWWGDMINIPRRSFLTGLASLVAAPAIVRVSSLMPVKPVKPVKLVQVVDDGVLLVDYASHTQDAVRYFVEMQRFDHLAALAARKDYDFYTGESWPPFDANVLRKRTVIAVNRLPTLERMTP